MYKRCTSSGIGNASPAESAGKFSVEAAYELAVAWTSMSEQQQPSRSSNACKQQQQHKAFKRSLKEGGFVAKSSSSQVNLMS
jgi:hypothetical protein